MPAPLYYAADDGIPQPPVTLTAYVALLTFLSAIGGFLFGYDTGIISGAMLFIKSEFHLSLVQVEFVVGATTFGAIFGGFGAGYLSDRIGRKPVTLIASIVFVAGAAMMAFAHSYELLLAGRVVVGLGVGLASMVVPAYISEIAPKELRGQLVTVNVLMITGGQLIAYLASLALAGVDGGWRIMMGVAAIPAAIQLVGMPFLPESPRYLYAHGKIDEARSILTKVYGAKADPDGSRVQDELSSIEAALRETQGTQYMDLFGPGLRVPILIACSLQLLQQFSGINTAMYYSASILRMAGFREPKSAIGLSILVAATNMAMTMVALKLVDRVGRRRIMLVTVAGMVIGLTLLGLAFVLLLGLTPYRESCEAYADACGACNEDERCVFQATNTCLSRNVFATPELANASAVVCVDSSAYGWFALCSLVFYVATYALGLGNVPWLIQSEIFPPRLRGKAGGMATSVNWIGNLIVSITFLSLTRAITAAGTFWLYGAIGILGWAFIYKMVPETKGKSLEEIRRLFEARPKDVIELTAKLMSPSPSTSSKSSTNSREL